MGGVEGASWGAEGYENNMMHDDNDADGCWLVVGDLGRGHVISGLLVLWQLGLLE